jgi:hypothetical protein
MVLVDHAAAEVAAMQFAGGMSVRQVAEQWERDADWVEAAIWRALLETVPKRSGGLKAARRLAYTGQTGAGKVYLPAEVK